MKETTNSELNVFNIFLNICSFKLIRSITLNYALTVFPGIIFQLKKIVMCLNFYHTKGCAFNTSLQSQNISFVQNCLTGVGQLYCVFVTCHCIYHITTFSHVYRYIGNKLSSRYGIQHKSTYLKICFDHLGCCGDCVERECKFAKCSCVDNIFDGMMLRRSIKFNSCIKQVWVALHMRSFAFYTFFKDVRFIDLHTKTSTDLLVL